MATTEQPAKTNIGGIGTARDLKERPFFGHPMKGAATNPFNIDATQITSSSSPPQKALP
jgi:hypothetical protein